MPTHPNFARIRSPRCATPVPHPPEQPGRYTQIRCGAGRRIAHQCSTLHAANGNVSSLAVGSFVPFVAWGGRHRRVVAKCERRSEVAFAFTPTLWLRATLRARAFAGRWKPEARRTRPGPSRTPSSARQRPVPRARPASDQSRQNLRAVRWSSDPVPSLQRSSLPRRGPHSRLRTGDEHRVSRVSRTSGALRDRSEITRCFCRPMLTIL